MSSVFEQNRNMLPKPKYEYINKLSRAQEILEYLSTLNMIEVDTEGTGLDPYTSQVSLVQLGAEGKAYVFDVRKDIGKSEVDLLTFKALFTDKNVLKLLQNAVYDMKMIKVHADYYINNIYDTMLVEQLFNLGKIKRGGASLNALVLKYLGLHMDKEPRNTFKEYEQTFEPFQLEYAATDVTVLTPIRDMQIMEIEKHKLRDAARLEFEFTKPLCEMELNGVKVDAEKWRIIMKDVLLDKGEAGQKVHDLLAETEDQTTLFGVSTINIDSNAQLKKALIKYGLPLENTSVGELKKYKGLPVIDALLDYRKADKLISTYAEPLLEKIHSETGRLHTGFKQMVSTGRMSSSRPNLQNIPGKQKYRSCFIAKEGCVLITADMSGAELRILGNMSEDPIFIESYANGIDLHTRAASEVFNVPYDQVDKSMRTASKAIQFGLCYGLSKFGLAQRLGITDKKAQKLIDNYFNAYQGVHKFLEMSAKAAVIKGYSRSISGRKRFYNLPAYSDPDRKRAERAVGRQAKNAPIQGSNADTIKQSMIYCVERLETLDYYAKLLLTVHDEIIVETIEEKKYEVADIVAQSLVDGFGKYFSKIPMETDALIGPCWLKGECENKSDGKNKCLGSEFIFVPDEKYKTKLICKKCGVDI